MLIHFCPLELRQATNRGTSTLLGISAASAVGPILWRSSSGSTEKKTQLTFSPVLSHGPKTLCQHNSGKTFKATNLQKEKNSGKTKYNFISCTNLLGWDLSEETIIVYLILLIVSLVALTSLLFLCLEF